MITEQNILHNTPFEVIQILINDLKEGDIRQSYLLKSLNNVNFSNSEQSIIEQIISDLIIYCEQRLIANDSHAMFVLGYISEIGLGVPQDFAKAINFYEQAIILDNAEAMNNRAFMYEKGFGGDVDLPAAIDLYEQAIKLDNSNAMNSRALLLPKNTVEDLSEKIRLYEKAIESENVQAMYNYASMYCPDLDDEICISESNLSEVRRLSQDRMLSAARRLLQKAIEFGDLNSMAQLAYMDMSMMEGGSEEEQIHDIHQLSQRLERLIEFGNVNALFWLALCGVYINDYTKAARSFRRAVEKNHLHSLDELIECSEDEDFVLNAINTYTYHKIMVQGSIEEAVDLVLNNTGLIEEFIEFDCKHELNKPHNLQRIKDFLEQYEMNQQDRYALNYLYCSALITLNLWEKNTGYFVQEILLLTAQYLTKINIANIKDENLLEIMQLVIDTWFSVDGFTKDAAGIICQLMYKLKLSGNDAIFDDSLKTIALILVKNIYGEDFCISTDCSLSLQQIMLLVTYNEGPQKIAVQLMNQLLGADIIFTQPDMTTILDDSTVIAREALTSSTGLFSTSIAHEIVTNESKVSYANNK